MIQVADLVAMLKHMTEVLERRDQDALMSSGDVVVMDMTDPEQERRAFVKVSFVLDSKESPDKLEQYIKDLGCELIYDKESCDKLVYIAKTIGVKT